MTNHIYRKVGSDVQKRINALKTGQKMQDLPRDLWHESFKRYVDDPTRMGGPNLRIIRLDANEPSLTVTGHIYNKFVHPYEDRFITVREAARLQGLPDDLHFVGSLGSSQLQVGNAVPLPLSKALFNTILAWFKHQNKQNIHAMSFFCGAGGLDIGAELARAGNSSMEVDYSCDIWGDACATLQQWRQRNNKQGTVVVKDIRLITDPLSEWHQNTGIPTPPDLVFGGPPCQSFSQAGKQECTDDRGLLVFEYLRVVDQLRPPIFLMENVPNLKGVSDGKIFAQIMHAIDKMSYNVCFGVLKAEEFGTPQKRRRAIFIGTQKGLPLCSLPTPTHADSHMGDLFALLPLQTVGEAFANLPEAE